MNIEPVASAIQRNGDIGQAGASFIDGGEYEDMWSGTLKERANVFFFEWKSPTFTPERLIKITIASKKYIRVTDLQRIEYVPPN